MNLSIIVKPRRSGPSASTLQVGLTYAFCFYVIGGCHPHTPLERELELELELIQMKQKLVLRAKLCARALRASQYRRLEMSP